MPAHSWADPEAELKEQPPAVQKTAREQVGKAGIDEVEPAFEEGRHATEVEYRQAGKKMAVIIAPDGTLIQKEHRLSPAEAPPEIQKALVSRFPGYTISHVTQVDRRGKVFFEVSVRSQGKSHQLTLDPFGKPVR